jgi:tetratricopeptide (TPR) repeat protein/transcriptional regulator with XRE-family HTH domain
MVMPHKPGSKAYREELRTRLRKFGVDGRHLIEQVMLELLRCGCRPREAWRLACEFTQGEVAAQFNELTGDPDIGTRSSRICEWEKWPTARARPSIRALETLAKIYGTTWDRLVDVHDLERMPVRDQQAYLDISHLRYSDPLNSLLPQRRHRHPNIINRGDNLRVSQLIADENSSAVREWLSAPSLEPPSDRLSSVLPGDATHFTGRDGPMIELREQVTENTPQGTVVSIYAIDGMAGVGKTAFARHAAQEFREHYPDGAIWVDLHGHTPGMPAREPYAALELMLVNLGVPPAAIKSNLVERQDQWRRHIHARRMLIVLDDALSSDQVLPLLPEAPHCLVLITSRRKLTGLTDAYPLSLDVLGWDEAERLFIKLVGEQRCEDRNAVRQILTACDRLPLAIRLIAGRLRHHRDEILAEVAADLADQAAALDAFTAEHLSVRAAFKCSHQLLTDEQRRAFRLLGCHPGPAITLLVITAMANLSPAQGKQLLRELVDHNLLDQLPTTGVLGSPRYRMHDLVRLYARECADADESPTERAAAVDRLVSSYMTITRAADRLLGPYAQDNSDEDESAAQETIPTFADPSQARAWLSVERHNLLACVQAIGLTAETASLSTVLAVHLRDLGFWSDVRYLYRQALDTYRHLSDRSGEVEALWGLGQVEWLGGEYGQARDYYTQALTLAQHIGDRRREAHALCGMGDVEWLFGEYAQAREYYTLALDLARQLSYQRAEAEALWGLGDVEWLVGEYGQAREYYTLALDLARQLGYQRAEAEALCGLGEVERLVGEYGRAREYCTAALTLAQHLSYRFGEVGALRGLGEVERLVGEYGQARDYHAKALALARRLGYRRAEAEALWGLGEVERFVGEYSQARDYHAKALTLARRLGYRHAEAEALGGLGQVELHGGEYRLARGHFTESLALAQPLGYRRAEAEALRGLGHVERFVGAYGKAREHYTQALTITRQLGSRVGETGALRGLGHVERLVGDFSQARGYFTQALALAQHIGDQFGEVSVLDGLGRVEALANESGLARDYQEQALALARNLGDRRGEALALRGRGEVEQLAGECDLARGYYTQALTLAQHRKYRFDEVLALRGLGEVEQLAGECDLARDYYTQALTLAQHLGDRLAEAGILVGLQRGVDVSRGRSGPVRD